MKQTCLNHYGVESPPQSNEVRHKIIKSMKKNGNYSSFESLLEKELKQHNIKYEIQYNKKIIFRIINNNINPNTYERFRSSECR